MLTTVGIVLGIAFGARFSRYRALHAHRMGTLEGKADAYRNVLAPEMISIDLTAFDMVRS